MHRDVAGPFPARRAARCGVLVLLALALGEPVGAVRLSGRATTVVRLHDLHLPEFEDVRSFRSVDEIVHLSLRDLGRRRAWDVDVTLRGRLDLATGVGSAQEDLQVLVARASTLLRGGDLRLTIGRQRSLTGLGWSPYDGVRLDVRGLRRARFFVFAGLPVETGRHAWPDADGHAYGAGASVSWPRRGSFGLDYELRNREGTTVEEAVGADLRLEAARTRFVANADYSLLQATFARADVALEQRVGRRHSLEARVTRTRPVFPADSILAVFVSNPSTETRLSYAFRGKQDLEIGFFVSREDFRDTKNPDVPAVDERDLPEDIERVAVSASFDGPRRGRHFIEAGWQRGWSGTRLGGRADSDVDLVKGLRIGGGVSVHRYQNLHGLTAEDEQVSFRLRLSHDHRARWQLSGSVEYFLGQERDSLRGVVVFSVNLGEARRRRPWWGGLFDRSWPGGAPRAEPRASEPAPDAVSPR